MEKTQKQGMVFINSVIITEKINRKRKSNEKAV